MARVACAMPPKVGTRRYGWRLGTLQNLLELVARTEEDKQLVVLFARTCDCMQTQGKANHSCTDTQRHAKHTHTHWVWNVPRMKVKSKFAQCVHLGCDRYVCMKLCANTRAHTHAGTHKQRKRDCVKVCHDMGAPGAPNMAHTCKKGRTSSRVTHVATMRAVHWLLVPMSMETSPLWPPPQVAAIW